MPRSSLLSASDADLPSPPALPCLNSRVPGAGAGEGEAHCVASSRSVETSVRDTDSSAAPEVSGQIVQCAANVVPKKRREVGQNCFLEGGAC